MDAHTMRCPFLVGERVYLRPLEEDDAPASIVWLNDPAVRRTLALHARPTAEAAARAYIRDAGARADQLFAVVTRADGVHVGNAGLHAIDAADRAADLGLVLGPPAVWGRGYGTETVALLCRHAFATLALHRVQLSCYANNPRALALYRRAGFVEEGCRRQAHWIEGAWVDEIVLGMLAGELRT